VVVGDFNTSLSPIGRSSKQKSNKEILELNHTIGQMDLDDVYRIFHPTSAQYTFFSADHGTFSKTDHINRELKKLNSPKINEPIKKWATKQNTTFSKEEIQMLKKKHEKMLTISSHKENVNQNHTKIPSHTC
jgi:hypothetical protein